MAQRYEILFNAQKDLYSEGLPFILSAGALTKDNKDKKLLIQLKVKNLSDKPVKGAKITFDLYDTVGKSLDESVTHEYLDIVCDRGREFGSKIPVYVENLSTRSFKVSAVTIMYNDNTVYEAENLSFEPLVKNTGLKTKLGGDEYSEYISRLTKGRNYEFIPQETLGLWVCACGEFNKCDSILCSGCGSRKEKVFDIDATGLKYSYAEKAMNSAVLEKEFLSAAEKFEALSGYKDSEEKAALCREKAEEAGKEAIYRSAMREAEVDYITNYESAIEEFQKISGYKDSDEQIEKCRDGIEKLKKQAEEDEQVAKKCKKIIAAIIACAAFLIVLTTVIIPNVKYSSAVRLYEAEKYSEAIEKFNSLGDFKDSKEQIAKCNKGKKYNSVITLYNEGKYRAALENFKTIIDFKDSKEQIENCKEKIYENAVSLSESKSYDDAIDLFKYLGDFKDSKGEIYKIAVSLSESKSYDEAIDLFKYLGDFKDSKGEIYKIAVSLSKSKSYDEAMDLFKYLGDFKDSKDKISECNYKKAVMLYKNKKYNEAIDIFKELGDYKDSSNRIVKCKIADLKSSKVGDIIKFGSYEQDDYTYNGKEEIEWKVLAKEKNKVLVISRYALDSQKYNKNEYHGEWEGCDLQYWLNNTFLNEAFSEEEQKKIKDTKVSADKNPEHNTNPGNATIDKVFLLSIPEAEKYFTTNESRRCALTDYAKAQSTSTSYSYETSSGEAACKWWLRSPGEHTYFGELAATVTESGGVNYNGNSVNNGSICVRPAMWISLD